jgi:hypothetical protein
MRRPWRPLGVTATVLALLVVGMAGYFGVDYWTRLAHGFRRVEEVRLIANGLGGRLDQGNVNGDFYLHLEGTSITDQQLQELAMKLKEFPPPYLDQNHRIEVNLNDTRVTNAGVEALANLDLQSIELRNTAVTDKMVPVLASMHRLWRVNLENTAVSREAQRQLADSLPYWPDLDQKAQALLAEPPTK